MQTSKDDIVIIIKTYTKDLFTYAFSKVQRKEIAEDMVQDTFLAAYQAYDNFKGKSNAKTWLFSILKHKIADYYRLRYKENTEAVSDKFENFFDKNDRWKPQYRPQDWGNEKELLDDPEFANALKNCLEKLPYKWSSVVCLKYLEEQDAESICNQLEISKSNFWQIVHRAKLSLRNCLELKCFK